MKSLTLLFVLIVLAPGAAFAGVSLHVPHAVGEWTVVDSEIKDPQLVAEPEPGSFYQFEVETTKPKKGAKQVATKVVTKVYHSTRKDDFDAKNKFRDAMHLVGVLPGAVQDVRQSKGEWRIVAKLPDSDELRQSKLEWSAIGKVEPHVRKGSGGKLRVALYDDAGSMGKGVPCCQAELGEIPGIELKTLNADGIRAGLSGYDVVIFSGGSGSTQAATIGLAGREQVQRFVNAGGGYVGICAGAYLACSGFSWGVGILNAKTPSPLWERGHADLKIETTKTGQKVLGLPGDATVIYHNGPIITPGLRKDLAEYEPLVFFRTEVSKTPKHAGLQVNTPAMVRGTFGKGHVLVSSPHPEQTAGMEHWIEKAVRAVAP